MHVITNALWEALFIPITYWYVCQHGRSFSLLSSYNYRMLGAIWVRRRPHLFWDRNGKQHCTWIVFPLLRPWVPVLLAVFWNLPQWIVIRFSCNWRWDKDHFLGHPNHLVDGSKSAAMLTRFGRPGIVLMKSWTFAMCCCKPFSDRGFCQHLLPEEFAHRDTPFLHSCEKLDEMTCGLRCCICTLNRWLCNFTAACNNGFLGRKYVDICSQCM